MKKLNDICKRYGIRLCYLFGSQKELGLDRLHGVEIEIRDPESDIDFAVSFYSPPENPAHTYANLSIDLGALVYPLRADLVFLHEVDHLIQFEAIQGINIFAADNSIKDAYETLVLAFAADETVIFKKNEQDFIEAVRNGYFEFEYQAHPG